MASRQVAVGGRLRIVLLGKTGAGKSSLGNTLLGRKEFKVGKGMASETKYCNFQEGDSYGTSVEITDTPGLCDTHLADAIIFREVGKSVGYAAPGPHVILVVLRGDRRFTEEEYKAYCSLKTLFGDSICERMIIVFNGLDELGENLREQRDYLTSQVSKMTGNIQIVLSEAGRRYMGMNNKASDGEKKQQAQELVTLMKELVASRGGMGSFFTSTLVNKIDGFRVTWIQNYMRKNQCTLEEAESAFREMIPNDKDFLQRLASVVQDIGATITNNLCLVM